MAEGRTGVDCLENGMGGVAGMAVEAARRV